MLYVDHLQIPFGRMKMSHLIADSPEDLREAADQLGFRREWIQYPGGWKEHLDVSESKRRQAIRELGAREITARELALMLIERREAANELAAGKLAGQEPKGEETA